MVAAPASHLLSPRVRATLHAPGSQLSIACYAANRCCRPLLPSTLSVAPHIHECHLPSCYLPRLLPCPGLCYVLLASLFWNFLRAAMAPAYAARCTWAHSAVTRFLVASATATLNAAAALHDRHLHGIDPLHTLEVRRGQWGGRGAGGGRRGMGLLEYLGLAWRAQLRLCNERGRLEKERKLVQYGTR